MEDKNINNEREDNVNLITEENKYATGRRKSSVARVWMKKGSGSFILNGLPMEEYFQSRDSIINNVYVPFRLLSISLQDVDIFATVSGSGISSQSQALRHGISRSFSFMNIYFRKIMKSNGLLVYDIRIVERKKYGQKKARKKFQFSKR